MDTFTVETQQRNEFIDITPQIQVALARRGIKKGAAVIYVMHTTAAVTVNENRDPNVAHDMLLWLERTVPQTQPGFRHAERNSDAHIKASLIGPSVMLIIEEGSLLLGRWQGVFLCEFDGPRLRGTVQVKWLGT